MLISNERFSVCPITTHIDLKDVSKKLTLKLFMKKLKPYIFGLKVENKKTKYWCTWFKST